MSQGGWDKARWVEAEWRGWRGMGQDWWGLGEEETREVEENTGEGEIREGEGRCPGLRL